MKYNILAHPSKGEYKEKGSTFMAYAHPITSIDQYKTLLTSYKADNPKACHVCSAYRFIEDKKLFEFSSDDGEPRGSAGLPLLNKLKSLELINVGVYVVRLFGGTKLGIPGLIRAYGSAIENAIDSGELNPWFETCMFQISCNYGQFNLVEKIVEKFNGEVCDKTFTTDVEIQVKINEKKGTEFQKELEEKINGKFFVKS